MCKNASLKQPLCLTVGKHIRQHLSRPVGIIGHSKAVLCLLHNKCVYYINAVKKPIQPQNICLKHLYSASQTGLNI